MEFKNDLVYVAKVATFCNQEMQAGGTRPHVILMHHQPKDPRGRWMVEYEPKKFKLVSRDQAQGWFRQLGELGGQLIEVPRGAFLEHIRQHGKKTPWV